MRGKTFISDIPDNENVIIPPISAGNRRDPVQKQPPCRKKREPFRVDGTQGKQRIVPATRRRQKMMYSFE